VSYGYIGGQLNIDRCPRCGVARPQVVLQSNAGAFPAAAGYATTSAAIYRCTTCGGALLATAPHAQSSSASLVAELLPSPKVAHADLPPAARRYLDQAYQTLAAPDAATVMAGSAVDAMLKALGYDQGSVYTRINTAVAVNLLTAGCCQSNANSSPQDAGRSLKLAA